MVESDRDSMSHCSSHGNRVPMGNKHMKELENQRFSLRNSRKIADGIAEWFGGKGVLQKKYRWALSLQKDFD